MLMELVLVSVLLQFIYPILFRPTYVPKQCTRQCCKWSSDSEFVPDSVQVEVKSFQLFRGEKSLSFCFVCTGIYCNYRAGPCGTAW